MQRKSQLRFAVLVGGFLLSAMAQAADYYVATTGNDANAGTSGAPFLTLGHAIGVAAAGDTIHIGAGNFNETNTVSKPLHLVGAGPGTVVTSALSANQGVFNLDSGASGSSMRMLRLQVPVTNYAYGIYITDASTVNGLTLDQVLIDGGSSGGTVTAGFGARSGRVTGLRVADSAFRNLYHGVIQQHIDPCNAADRGMLSDVRMTRVIFSDNAEKGLYVEGLSDALFDEVQVLRNGAPSAGGPNVTSSANGAGFDINLKGASYQNIVIRNSTFTQNGVGTRNGAAIMVKARDDRSYTCAPARLTGVTVENNQITGNERGVRFGEPMNINVVPGTLAYNAGPANVLVRYNTITGNVPSYSDPGGAPADAFGAVIDHTLSPSIAVNRNNLSGNGLAPNDQNGILNPHYAAFVSGNNTVDGRCNWWGAANGPRNSLTASALLTHNPQTPTPQATGTGDMVGSDITYLPFLMSSNLRGPCTELLPWETTPALAPVPADSPWALLLVTLGVLAAFAGWRRRQA